MKATASKKRRSTKDYINAMFLETIGGDKFIHHMLPRCQKWAMNTTFCLFKTQTLAKLLRYDFFDTVPFTVMYVILRNVSIFTRFCPAEMVKLHLHRLKYLKLGRYNIAQVQAISRY